MELSKKINYQVIEPISTVIFLALLSLKDEYTKISIYNNYLYFRENSYMQGIIRWGYGETREDIFSLQVPLIMGIKWIKNKNKEKYNNILLSCVNGVMKLSKCYEEDNQTNLFLLQTARKMQEIVLSDQENKTFTNNYAMIEEDYYPKSIDNNFINLLWENDIDLINENINLIYNTIENYPNLKEIHTKNCIKNIKSVLKKKYHLFSKKIKV